MSGGNYEQWKTDWRARIRSLIPDALCRRLPFLRVAQQRLWVPYLGKTVAIRLADGVPEAPESWSGLSLMDEMNIDTMLWYAKEGAHLTGRWGSFESLRDARPFGPAFRRGILAPFAATFSGHSDLLAGALKALGGTPLPTGDVGYELPVFPCIPMRVLFWEGDEEFPAQCNLLFDESAPDFTHVESVVSIASETLKHLAVQSGLPVQGSIIDVI